MRFAEYNLLVIEMVASYGMAVGETVFETCVWIGKFMQIAENIERFDASKQLGSYSFDMLTEGNTDEGEE